MAIRCWIRLLLTALAIAPSSVLGQTTTQIAACAAGPVSGIADTRCSVQDFVLIFGGASIMNDTGTPGLTTNSITFTPVSNGFMLSGTISADQGEGDDSLVLTVHVSPIG